MGGTLFRCVDRWVTLVEMANAKRTGLRRADGMRRKLTLRTMAAVFDEWTEAVWRARKEHHMLRKVSPSEPPEPAHVHNVLDVCAPHVLYKTTWRGEHYGALACCLLWI